MRASWQFADEPHVSDTLVWIYYKKNLASTAVQHLEATVRGNPTEPVSHYHLGMAYADRRLEKAKNELQKAPLGGQKSRLTPTRPGGDAKTLTKMRFRPGGDVALSRLGLGSSAWPIAAAPSVTEVVMGKMKLILVVALFAGSTLLSSRAEAASFSFTGNFFTDDNVQLFNFVVGVPSTVTLTSWSYAGGTNALGAVIPRGGFDPILALFDSTGALINQDDDGSNVNDSGVGGSGQSWDVFLSAALGAGSYTVSVMQYNNFAIGPNLANGFVRTGQGNFTGALASCAGNGSFEDVSGALPGCQRDNHWAFDILNVASAVVVPPNQTAVPEPASMILVGSGLIAALRRRSRKPRVAASR
jgi:hypothetical protein